MIQPFIVFGLPRSRTFWVSRFLTYGDWACGHDEIRHVRSLEDVTSYFSQPCVGAVETAAAPWWRLLVNRYPEMRFATLRRPVDDVLASLGRFGFFDMDRLARAMRFLDAKLDQIEKRVPGVLRLAWEDLATEGGCRALWEHCLPLPWDERWWRSVSAINLQLNMSVVLRQYEAFKPQLERVAKVAKHKSIALMSAKHRTDTDDALMIGEESVESLYRDGQDLFKEHALSVGEPPDVYQRKNVPLMTVLEKIGCLHITSARSNGRMFGYLMTVIGPSLEAPHIKSAVPTLFYASPEFPGLGRKLQRASIAKLRERGVNEFIFRAGPRGDGPRTASLYRRLGAEDNGHLFVLRDVPWESLPQ